MKYYYYGELEFPNHIVDIEPEYFEFEQINHFTVFGGNFVSWEFWDFYKTPGVMPLTLALRNRGPEISDNVHLYLSVPEYVLTINTTGDKKEYLPAGTYKIDTDRTLSQTFQYVPSLIQGSFTQYSVYWRQAGNSGNLIEISLEDGNVTTSFPGGNTLRVEAVLTGKNRISGQPATLELIQECDLDLVIYR